jgi:hypothetical protein
VRRVPRRRRAGRCVCSARTCEPQYGGDRRRSSWGFYGSTRQDGRHGTLANRGDRRLRSHRQRTGPVPDRGRARGGAPGAARRPGRGRGVLGPRGAVRGRGRARRVRRRGQPGRCRGRRPPLDGRLQEDGPRQPRTRHGGPRGGRGLAGPAAAGVGERQRDRLLRRDGRPCRGRGSAPPGDGFLPSLCVEWEEATAPVQEAGVRTVFARTGLVVAREGGAWAKLFPLYKAGLGGTVRQRAAVLVVRRAARRGGRDPASHRHRRAVRALQPHRAEPADEP